MIIYVGIMLGFKNMVRMMVIIKNLCLKNFFCDKGYVVIVVKSKFINVLDVV